MKKAGILKSKKKNQGISLLLVILIVGAILVGVIIIADIVNRQAQVTQGFDFSEKAFMAAQTCKEKVAYNINKDFCKVDLSSDCNVEESHCTTTLVIDREEPNTGQTTGIGEDITNSNPWEIKLQSTATSTASFVLNLDLNSQDSNFYPSTLTVAQEPPSSSGELIFWYCETAGTPRICTSSVTSTTYVTFPQPFTLSGSGYYYKLRINNTSGESATYILTPSSSDSLPIGVIINSVGTFKDYERKIKFSLPKWQIF